MNKTKILILILTIFSFLIFSLIGYFYINLSINTYVISSKISNTKTCMYFLLSVKEEFPNVGMEVLLYGFNVIINYALYL